MSGLNLVSAGALGNTPKSIIGTDSAALGLPMSAVAGYSGALNLKKTLAGALTANTYKTLLSVTGAGVLNFLALLAMDATARTASIRLTLDGVVVSTRTGNIAAVNDGFLVVGSAPFNTTNSAAGMDAVPFSLSMLVEVKSNLTETDTLATFINYRTC